MKIDIITIFKEAYSSFLNTSIVNRAIKSKHLEVNLHNLRDFSLDKNQKVDDTVYGGSVGMLMSVEPIHRAISALKKNKNVYVVAFSPQGKPLNQELLDSLAKKEHLILLPGHYEGYDARTLNFIDLEISIGDFVLTSGILPSQILIDGLVRLIPGVINQDSVDKDTFKYNSVLKYPQYTKPTLYQGLSVPDILLSGNHQKVDEYNFEQAVLNTLKKRIDLIKNKAFYLDTYKKIKAIIDKAKDFKKWKNLHIQCRFFNS